MTGKIIQVMGPVVDVEFSDYLPEINEALETTLNVNGKEKYQETLILSVLEKQLLLQVLILMGLSMGGLIFLYYLILFGQTIVQILWIKILI